MIDHDWKRLLADPGPDGHIVQLYQDADFYGEAISHFAAEGLVRGESVILVATPENWQNVCGRLEHKGFTIAELFGRGQLTVLDANQTLPKFMKDGTPDGNIFKPLAVETIKKARCNGIYPRVRWWGEMVNLLYVDGNGKGSNQLEQYFDEVAHEETIAIFCSFLMDKYDPRIYDDAFCNVCSTHSNVIHTHDYASHRHAVSKAISDVLGPMQGALLKSLMEWKSGVSATMPSSQALLLWVKDARPKYFGQVLDKAKAHEAEFLAAGLSNAS